MGLRWRETWGGLGLEGAAGVGLGGGRLWMGLGCSSWVGWYGLHVVWIGWAWVILGFCSGYTGGILGYS